jgi:hypothetical protein
MRTLRAIDLAGSSADATRWRAVRWATVDSGIELGDLPPGSLITPAGFAFVANGSVAGDAPHVQVLSADELRAQLRTGATLPSPRADERILPIVSLLPESARTPAVVPAGGLILEIGRRVARVGVDEQAWPSVAGPVLLAISQCWRFRDIDHRMEELSTWARTASQRPRSAGIPQFNSRIDQPLQVLRAIVLDLPGTEGPLSDPRGYFANKRAAKLYGEFARGLGLTRWRDLLDERIEIVEAMLADLAEERRHRVSVGSAIALEVLILIALIADLAINLAGAFE